MIMKKIYGVVTLVAMLMGATLVLERTVRVAAAAPIGIKNVVLVHGAFADGSGWEAVAKILEKDGYTVSVAQPPETSYADDQKYTKAASTPWAARLFWSATATAGPSSARPGTIQTLRHLSTSRPLRSMKVTVVLRSNRPYRKPPRHSSRIATATGGSNRTISRPTSQRIFLPPSPITWLYRRCRSPLTRLPTRSRVPPGRPSRLGTWWPPQTGRSIRTRSA